MSPAKSKPSATASPLTAAPKTVFYARVSTRDQKLDLQVEAARKLGIPTENIFVEKASGVRHDRPVLEKALAALSPGDTLAAYKLDRIGRSLAHVTKLLADLEARGVHFRTIDDGISTKGPTGRMVLHMLGAVAQFERDLILERTRAGIEAAKKNGKKMGRKRKRSAELAKQARSYMLKDGLNADDAARVLKVSRRTMFRALKEAREHDALVSAGG